MCTTQQGETVSGGENRAFEPASGAMFTVGQRHVVQGRSWPGADAVARVDVSTDDGVN
ncbi:hypothetical protein [Streptomyces paradoxus]|uniref:hypothetical protein n=1 Tax=Streptomyces paradoxus TaxID=66375 RepID=UPI0037D7870B